MLTIETLRRLFREPEEPTNPILKLLPSFVQKYWENSLKTTAKNWQIVEAQLSLNPADKPDDFDRKVLALFIADVLAQKKLETDDWLSNSKRSCYKNNIRKVVTIEFSQLLRESSGVEALVSGDQFLTRYSQVAEKIASALLENPKDLKSFPWEVRLFLGRQFHALRLARNGET